MEKLFTKKNKVGFKIEYKEKEDEVQIRIFFFCSI